ncbi:MAG TPA: translation initiation factor IF-2, partial [archaeon]|nr:translation initiation factor IF-2 [archaeon]
MKIRQPIVSVLGHVDHGKTSILDKIRGSNVYAGEAGGITQHIGASEVPIESIQKTCGDLLKKMNINLTIPGLLFIDTPGHEAFTTLRKRGGAIADLAVLVIDVNEGFQPQTEESLLFLKEFKTPFVVAANKIDRTMGWTPNKGECFIKTIKEQQDRVVEDLETKIYTIIGQLAEKGYDSERYDRVGNFGKQICIVPTSGVTGEGIADLIVVLSGLAEKFLKDSIKFEEGEGKGTVLEVKEHKGLGLTIDAIIYNGEVNKGDILVIGGKEIIETKIKALLKPEPLKELRAEKKFQYVDSVVAASGIKISAPGLEKVVAGSPLRTVKNEKDVEKVKQEIVEEVEEVEIHTEGT